MNYVDPTGHSLIAAALSGIAWAASILVAVTTFKVVETVVEQTVEYVANNPKAKAGISAMAGASLGITLPKMMEELQEVYEQEYTGSSLGKILDLSEKIKEKQEAEQEKMPKSPTVVPKDDEEDKKSVLFPENPMDFQPMGLQRSSYNNGETIKWEVPGTKYAIFEWNMRENKNVTEPKPHYHVMTIYDKNKHNDKMHYFPGQKVPE